ALFDSLLNESIINFFILAGNAYGYQFESDHIVPTHVYGFFAKGVRKFEVKTNPIPVYLNELEEFVRKSNYRKFYADHERYYQAILGGFLFYMLMTTSMITTRYL